MSRPFLIFLGFMALLVVGAVAAISQGLIPPEMLGPFGANEFYRLPDQSPPPKLKLNYPKPEDVSLFVGPEGVDGDGYPLRSPNGVALLSMLHARQFQELTGHIEGLQEKFEQDHRYELVIDRAFWSFGTADPMVTPLLEAWRKSSPESFVPVLAQAVHQHALGWNARGHASGSKTSDEQRRRMKERHTAARKLALKAADMRPKAISPHDLLIKIAKTIEQAEGRQQRFEAATKVCPLCVQPYIYRMYSLAPKWHGSNTLMEGLARRADSLITKNSRFATVRATADAERCSQLMYQEDYEKAERFCGLAARVKRNWNGAYEHAFLLEHQKKLDKVRRELDRGLEAAPANLSMLQWRARLHAADERWKEAVEMARTAWLLDPAEERSNALGFKMHAWVRDAAQQAFFFDADAATTIELADLGLTLRPHSRELLHFREQSLKGVAAGKEIDARQKAAADNPDSLEDHKRLDEALCGLGRLAESVEIWDDFLIRQPQQPEALTYRGGSYLRMRKNALAHADLQKACDLGYQKACRGAEIAAGYLKAK